LHFGTRSRVRRGARAASVRDRVQRRSQGLPGLAQWSYRHTIETLVIAPMKNVHGNTVDHLGAAIVAGRYVAGAAMPPEPKLCEELGVSRTVVRESVKSLVAKGLVSTGPKVGTRVLSEDKWNWFDPDVILWKSKAGLTREFLRDLQDLRRILEPAAVRMAAERASAADLAEIEAAFEAMQQAAVDGVGDYVACDLRFHQGLLRASHNRMIVQMNKVLGALLRTSFEISTSRKDGPRSSLPLHRAVLSAVLGRNPARAEKATLALIDSADRDIEEVLATRRRRQVLNPGARPRAA
jgi:DNA-binding FadR family transcriptional regulator